MGKVRLTKVTLAKDKLATMPECERGVFIYSGHISNEINCLSKFMLFLQTGGSDLADRLQSLTPGERAILDGHTAQILIVLKLLAGKNHEAVMFLKRWCFEKPWFEDLCAPLPEKARTARIGLEESLKQFEGNSKSSLTKLIRDKSAFHYDDAAVKACRSISSRVEEVTVYFADTVGNTLYLGSEFAIADFLIERSNQGDPKEVLDKLMQESLDMAGWIKDLLGHTMARLTAEYFGGTIKEIGQQEEIFVEASLLEDMRLPYYFDSQNSNTRDPADADGEEFPTLTTPPL